MPTIIERSRNAFKAFMNRDPPSSNTYIYGGTANRPDRFQFTRGNAKSIMAPYYNKIAMDCASVALEHVRVDEDGNYVETINSHLNNCLTVTANKDQTARAFIQDAVMSMFDEGVVALAPIDFFEYKRRNAVGREEVVRTDVGSFRTAKITRWYPNEIELDVYNDQTGKREKLIMPKERVPILENPLYSVMNEPNSTVQRLIRTLNLSDTIDNQNTSGKLDMIIQLPYSVKTPARKAIAEQRQQEIRDQLTGSQHGIAYIDGTEKVIQLNRAVENTLYDRVEYLMNLTFDQLGFTNEIMNGTANETTMQNYYTRTIEPIVAVLIDNLKWKSLTEWQRANGETIQMFRDPFKIMPVGAIADAADKFTRNEIMAPNEWRPKVGMKPVKDAQANELRNRNISQAKNASNATVTDDTADEH